MYHAVEDNSLQCCVLWLCITTNFSCWTESRGQSDDWVPESKRSGTWSGCSPLWLQYCTHTSSATVPTRPHHSHSEAPPYQGRVSICSFCKQQIEISNYSKISFFQNKVKKKNACLNIRCQEFLWQFLSLAWRCLRKDEQVYWFTVLLNYTVYVSCLKSFQARWTSTPIHCINKLPSSDLNMLLSCNS